MLSSRIATLSVIVVSMILDFMGWTFHAPLPDMILGYMALALSVLVVPLPLSTQGSSTGYKITTKSAFGGSDPMSRLVATPADVNVTARRPFNVDDLDRLVDDLVHSAIHWSLGNDLQQPLRRRNECRHAVR